MSGRFKLDSDWTRFFLTIAFFAVIHFGDNRYVRKAEHTADLAALSAELRTVGTAIVSMDKSIALLETARRVQDDHETRIRALEQRTKLSIYEKNPQLVPSAWASLSITGDR